MTRRQLTEADRAREALEVAQARYKRIKAKHDAAVAAAAAIEPEVEAAAAVVEYAAKHPALPPEISEGVSTEEGAKNLSAAAPVLAPDA